VKLSLVAVTAGMAALATPATHRAPDERTLLGKHRVKLPLVFLLHVEEGTAKAAPGLPHRAEK
jgi:hypothetical protein